MTNRSRGIAALSAGGVAIVLGMVSFMIGMLASSLLPIHVSIACSVLAGPLCILGVVLLALDHR